MKFVLKYPYFVVGFVFILLGAAFKFYYLTDFELQGDEAFSVFHAQQSIDQLLATLNSEANPPLYYLLLHGWIKVGGIDPLWVKSLNILFSLITAIMLVLVGKRMRAFSFTFFISIAFLSSNLHFEFSHEIRAFQLVLLLTAGSYYFFISYFETRNWKFLLGITVTTFALPFTHYNAALVVIVQGIASLFFIRKQWELVWKLWIAYLIAGLCFLPQFFIFRSVVPDSSFWLGLSKWDDFIYIAQTVTGYQGKYLLLLVPYFLLPLVVIIFYRKKLFTKGFRWEYFFYFWMLYSVPLMLNFLLAQYTPSFQLRYVLFTGFGIFFSLGYALSHLKKPKFVGMALILFLSVVFIWEFSPSKKDNEGWKDTASFIHQMRKTEKVGVVITASYKLKDLIYYLDRPSFANYSHFYDGCFAGDVYGLKDTLNLAFMGDLNRFDKIVYLRSNAQFEDETNSISQYFDKRFTKCYEMGDPAHTHIAVYNVGGNPCFSWKASGTFDEENKGRVWHVTDFVDELSGKHKFSYLYDQEKLGEFNLEGNEFSPGLFLPVNGISMVSAHFEITSDQIPNGIFVVSVELNGNAEKRIEFPLASYYSAGKGMVDVQVGLPLSISKEAELKCYIYNPNKEKAILSNYSITIWK